MSRLLIRAAATLPVVVIAATAAAQDGGDAEGGVGATTWFEMFFLPDNILGLGVVWLLLLMSAFSIGFSIKLAVGYRRSAVVPEDTRDELEALLHEKKYRDAIQYANEDQSYLGRITSAALNEASNGYAAMERAIEEASDTQVGRYLRPVEYLNVLGNISPMMGLFGTVFGMIVAFQKLVQAGGSPDPAQLAGGISTALVTTFWGLVVAIPALAAYSLIRNKIDALTSEGLLVAEELISPFKPRRKSSSRSGSSSSSSSSKSSSKEGGANREGESESSSSSKEQSSRSTARATPQPEE
jgi:biopolymer transport protein ExbB